MKILRYWHFWCCRFLDWVPKRCVLHLIETETYCYNQPRITMKTKTRNHILSCVLPVFAAGSWALAPAVQAAALVDRPALQAVLGGPGTLEDFESYVASPAGGADGIGVGVLDSTTIVNGQGPGLVVPGVTFTGPNSGLQWDDAGYFGAPSREILIGAPAGQPLGIDFAGSVGAFGVDLRAFSGFPATATMTIFAADDTSVIGVLSSLSLGGGGSPIFAGWEDAGGIGRVELTQTGQPWSPIIDNLEFGKHNGTPVPEAGSTLASLGLALAGLASLRRRNR